MKATPAKAKQAAVPPSKTKQTLNNAAAKTQPAKAVVKKASTAKPAPKPAAKAAAKSAAKPVTKTAHSVPKTSPGTARPKAIGLKPASKPATPTGVKSPVGIDSASAKTKAGGKTEINVPVKIPIRSEPAPVPMPVATAPTSVIAQRPGRPSSRLASLTVPSMAQSVASTAAKASYLQVTSAPLIVPPLPSAAKKDPKLANNWKTKPVEQLTDAELMAMPDSEYMNDKQMAAFRLKLALLKQEILNSAGETTEHLREDTVVVPDPADRATIEEEHALELRTRDRERKLLKKIEQSIARIDAGDYGHCDETGEPIGVGRLLARPTATLSLEAQQRRELKQKMFGD